MPNNGIKIIILIIIIIIKLRIEKIPKVRIKKNKTPIKSLKTHTSITRTKILTKIVILMENRVRKKESAKL